jgi:hypothetical protein
MDSEQKLTIEAIRGIWSKATPGPWKWISPSDTSHDTYGVRPVDGSGPWIVYLNRYEDDSSGCNEPEVIAAAPEHIAFLLAKVDALGHAVRIHERTNRECIATLAAANKRIAELESLGVTVCERCQCCTMPFAPVCQCEANR